MPHYKCETCKVRLYEPGTAAELVGDLCPECGSLLEPVGRLVELVGYRSITSRDGVVATPQSEPRRRIVDLRDESIARRASRLERLRLDAGWLGDSDEPATAAVALPPPGTYHS